MRTIALIAATLAVIAAAAFIAGGCILQLSKTAAEAVTELETCMRVQGLIAEAQAPGFPATATTVRGLMALAAGFGVVATALTAVVSIPRNGGEK